MNKQQLDQLHDYIVQLGFNVQKIEQRVVNSYPSSKDDKPTGDILLNFLVVVKYQP